MKKVLLFILTLLCVNNISVILANDMDVQQPIQVKKRKVSMERSLVILKPDCVTKHNMGRVISRLEDAGLSIVQCKIIQLDNELLKSHYSHIADKPFFPEVVEFMSSCPVMIMIVEGPNAIARIRNLLGPTDSQQALPGTVRGDFGTDKMRNIAHASDSKESAEIEINRFFK